METDWRFVLHSAYLFKLFNDINNIIQIYYIITPSLFTQPNLIRFLKFL